MAERMELKMYANKNEESKIIEYIAERFKDDNTVDIKVNAESEWFQNDMDEDCRYYSISKTLRRPFDGKIINGTPEHIRVQLDDADADEHYVQIYGC